MENNSISNKGTNKRLNNEKGQASTTSTHNPKLSFIENDLETDNVMSDDDEMC